MKIKKLFSFALALALMMLILTVPALAAGPELEIPGEVAIPPDLSEFLADKPEISVHVPASGWAIINPYGMEVEKEGVSSREQIVSPVLALENESDMPVRTDVRVIGEVPAGSEARFVPAPPSEDAPGKDIFMYAEFQNRPDEWYGDYVGAYNQVVVTEAGSNGEDLLTLEPWGEGYFKLFGRAAVPAEGVWTKTDVVNVTLAFTFEAAGTETTENMFP